MAAATAELKGGSRLEVRSPATRNLIATVPDATAADVAAAADAAAASFRGWSGDRLRVVRGVYDTCSHYP